MAPRSLTDGIVRTVTCLYVAQTAVMVGAAAGYSLASARSVLFLAFTFVYHGVLLLGLLALRPLFVLESDGSPLARVNASNALSLVRLSSLPTIVFLIVSAREAALIPVILPFLTVVFLTDFVDGRLARKLNQITAIGRYLDAFSDYVVLAATLFVYLAYGLVPWWLFVLILVRLGVVAVGNTLLYAAQGRVEPETSYLGKASIFAIMVLFAAKVLGIPYGLIFHAKFPLTLQRIENLQLMVAGVLIVATIEKLGLIGRRLIEVTREQKSQRDAQDARGNSARGS
jgi:phosphatidylglycerophosphate synthase